MPDYGRPLEFGISVEPRADSVDLVSRVVRTAERAGLDLVGIQDHPYQRRFLDTWTLISTLVPVTENVRFFPDVANLPLRPLAVLAKAAASLDVISGGRVGLGAGAFWDAVAGMGGPRRTPGEALRATEEAIRVMRMVWSEERSLRFDGAFYSLKGMRPGPRPAHGIGVWLGAYGPRMLGLIGRKADGWVPSLGFSPPDRLPAMHERIDGGVAEAGRDPSEIKRVYNVSGNIGPEGEGLLEGPVEEWVETLAGFVLEGGMDSFVFWPGGDHERQTELFAREVVPAVRGPSRGGVREGDAPPPGVDRLDSGGSWIRQERREMTETGRVGIPEGYQDLLESTALANVATVGPNGEPQNNPVWFDWDGEHVLFSQTKTRQKYRNLSRDSRVALSIVDPENPYRYLEIRGEVDHIEEDPDLGFINAMAKKYLGQDQYPFHQPGDERVVVFVRPLHTTQMGA